MNKNIEIGKIYQLFRDTFVLGISFSIYDHIHEDLPVTNEKVLTIEFLFWGVDISWDNE